ncbi:MAG: YbaB/EbfC family nucleoid-associated protein [Planctomycetota bacterium]
MVRNLGGNMNQMMKAAQKMQKDMLAAQEALKERFVEGEAGGGMVKVIVNGQKEVIKIVIAADFVLKEMEDEADVRTLEELVIAAIRNGTEKARKLAEESMGQVTGGLNLPGLF